MEGAVKVWHVGGDGNGELNGEFVKVGMKVMGFRGGLCVWLVSANGKELDLKILSLRKHRLSFVLFSAVVWLLGYAVREFSQHGVQPGDLAIIFKETVTLYGHPTQSKAYIFLKGVISLPSFHVRVAGDEENLFLEWYKEKGIRLILSIKIVKANVPIKTLVSTSAETFKCQILIIATGSTILVEANKAKKNGKADIVGEGYTELELGAASHTPLECALQTHPNITVIGEDVVAKKLSLKNLDYVSVCLPNASCRGHFTQQASLLLFMLDTKVESLKGFSRLNLEDKDDQLSTWKIFRISIRVRQPCPDQPYSQEKFFIVGPKFENNTPFKPVPVRKLVKIVQEWKKSGFEEKKKSMKVEGDGTAIFVGNLARASKPKQLQQSVDYRIMTVLS
ncbi:hypothetical protein V6N11_017185 [Hibiscus sabdariffa]|uniref:Uncharacterized protein n=1 Tax=Hibiscus sabdariffa TaxID=183260 RepID=A0ABR2TXF2_9ROSI